MSTASDDWFMNELGLLNRPCHLPLTTIKETILDVGVSLDESIKEIERYWLDSLPAMEQFNYLYERLLGRCRNRH